MDFCSSGGSSPPIHEIETLPFHAFLPFLPSSLQLTIYNRLWPEMPDSTHGPEYNMAIYQFSFNELLYMKAFITYLYS